MALVTRLAAVVTVLLTAPLVMLAADAPAPTEHQVKAAFIYNFSKFIEWPPASDPTAPFTVAVLGEDTFVKVLEQTLAGKTIMNRPLTLRRIASVKDLNQAHILFISSSERVRLPEIVKSLEGTNVLTVGEMDNFVRRGGMVGFRMEEDRVRFDINLDQVTRAHLKMSSQLLRLARQVISTGGAL